MDNRFYYGEYKIIGNREVKPEEWEPIVIYSSHYNGPDIPETTYLQYGLIFIQRPTRKLNPFLKKDIIVHPIYRGGGIGFGIPHYSDLENIITENVNNDSLLTANDLRKKSNYKVKKAIFRSFGLDADKSYAENLQIIENSAASPNTTPYKKGGLSSVINIFKGKFPSILNLL